MIVIPNFKHSTLIQCPPITLVRFAFRSRSTLAIKLSDEKQSTLVALLDHPEAPVSFASVEGHLKCLAYPADWVIELIPNEASHHGNNGYASVPGVIYSDDVGTFIKLDKAGSKSSLDSGLVNLKTGQFDSASKGAPFTNWHVWENENARDSDWAEPLFTFEAPL